MNYTRPAAKQIKQNFDDRAKTIKSSDYTTYQKDVAYASLMTELESIYGVPCMFPEDWENASKGNAILLELYRCISNMRAFEDEDTINTSRATI